MFELVQTSAFALSTVITNVNQNGLFAIFLIAVLTATTLSCKGMSLSSDNSNTTATQTKGAVMAATGIAIFPAILFSTLVVDYAVLYSLITLV